MRGYARLTIVAAFAVAVLVGCGEEAGSHGADQASAGPAPAPAPGLDTSADAAVEPAALPGDSVRVESVASIEVRVAGEIAHDVHALGIAWTPETPARVARGAEPSIAERITRYEPAASGRIEIAASELPRLIAVRAHGAATRGLLVQEPVAFAVDLPRARTLAGIIVDVISGLPLAGATVQAMRVVGEDAVDDIADRLVARAVVTGSDGRWSFDDLACATVELRAHLDGRSCEIQVVQPCETIVPGNLHEIALCDGATLTGRVADEANDQPIAGARVAGFVRFDRTAWAECGSTTTDAAGRFVLEGVRAAEDRIGVRVSSLDYGTRALRIARLSPGERRVVDVALRPACRAEGKVTDDRGRTVAGVTVSVLDPDTLDTTATCRTCGDGSFAMSDVEAGLPRYVLLEKTAFFQSGHGPAVLCGEPLELTIHAQPSITGRVTGVEAPISGSVTISYEAETGVRTWTRTGDIDPETGFFVVGDLLGGLATIDVRVDGLAEKRIERVPVPSNADLDLGPIELDRGVEISGVVRSRTTGDRLAGARVSLADMSVADPGLLAAVGSTHAVSDSAGAFTLPHVPRGRVMLVVECEGHARELVPLELSAASDRIFQDLLLSAGQRVTAAVLDAAGRRCRSVRGTAWCGDAVVVEGVPHADSVVFEGVPAGRVELNLGFEWLRAPWMAGRSFTRVIEVEPGRDATVDFTLARTGRVFGAISGPQVDATSRRYAVMAKPAAGGGGVAHFADVRLDRTYDLFGVEEGSVTITVYSEDGLADLQLSRDIEVVAGTEQRLDFHVPGGGFEGSVTREDGSPVLDASVRVRRAAPGDGLAAWRTTPVDRDGNYGFLGLDEGVHEFVIGAPGMGEVQGSFVLATDSSERRDAVLRPEGIVEAVVRAREGGTIGGAHASLAREDGPAEVSLTPEAESLPERWVFHGGRDGNYVLRAEAEGFFPGSIVVHCVEGRTATCSLILRRRGDLNVRVLSAEGHPLAGVPLLITDLETGTGAAVWLADGEITTSTGALATGADGLLELRGLPEGEFRIAGAGMVRDATVVGGSASGSVLLQQMP